MNFFTAMLLTVSLSSVLGATENTCINFDASKLHHIRFDDIAASQYRFTESGNQVNIEVKSSASFLFLPFKEITSIRSVTYEWQANSKLPLTTKKLLKTKKGDDLPLRIGLVVYGKQEYFSFLLPSWLKEIEKHLKFPSNQLVYLVSGSGIEVAGYSWESPYSSSITNIVVKESRRGEWWEALHRFTSPKEVVGLWIMSDGDDQKNSFKLNLRKLCFNRH